MAANKPQFDVLLGGTQDLPLEFSVGRFASARAQEIAALTQAIGMCIIGPLISVSHLMTTLHSKILNFDFIMF
jgi:hypothetical protein